MDELTNSIHEFMKDKINENDDEEKAIQVLVTFWWYFGDIYKEGNNIVTKEKSFVILLNVLMLTVMERFQWMNF